MEDGQHFALQRRTEINQEITAADQVQLRKWRVFGKVLFREHAHIANEICKLITATGLYKIPVEAVGRNPRDGALRKNPLSCASHHLLTDVGSKDLNRTARRITAKKFVQTNRK